MKKGEALLMLIFSVLLPTGDVFSDIFFTLKLFTGYGLKKNHPKYGALTLVPLTISWIGVTIHWFKTETREKRNKWKTLPLLIFQVYPQWRALRVLYYGAKKDPGWKALKEEFEGGISHLGNKGLHIVHSFCPGQF